MTHIDPDEHSLEYLQNTIQSAVNASQKVVVATPSEFVGGKTAWTLSNGQTILYHHAYVALGIEGTGDQAALDLYNPWGHAHVKVPLAELKNVILFLDID